MTDQAPTLAGLAGETDVTIVNGGLSPIAIAPALTVADTDNATESSAAIAISGGFQAAEDTLSFTNTGNIIGTYDSSTGVLTLVSPGASATLADWQAALRSVTYSDGSATPSAADRTISFTINDGTLSSSAATQTVHFNTPTLGGNSGTTYVGGLGATAIVPHLTLTDAGSATEASATVAITGNLHSAEDLLAFDNADAAAFGNIAGAYNASTGVLTLASAGATATLAQWQAALRAVTYADSAVSPDTSNRTISITVSDGLLASTSVSHVLSFDSAFDLAPTLAGVSGVTDLAIVSGVTPTPVAVAPALTVADPDNATEATATVAITSGLHAAEDMLRFVPGASFGNIAASYDAATGELTLSSSGATATQAEWQAALRSVTYTDISANPTAGDRTVSFSIDDGVSSSAGADQTVHVSVAATSPPSSPPPPPPHDGQSGEMFLGSGGSLTTGDGESTVVGSGQNTIVGGAGDDLIIAGAGPNHLRGGAGGDVISGGSGFDDINGNQGDDTINGGDGGDDWLLGGQGKDAIYANHGANILNGNLGDDTLHGGDGADTLRGGQGDDVIYAGSGDNWLSGDLGNNTLHGGQGMDTFHAGAGHDVVDGWHAGDHVQVDAAATYTVSQVNADVHIVFSDGGEMDLLNVQKDSLRSGWIFGS